MKGKKFQKYANIHQQFKPVPPQPLKKLNGLKLPALATGKEMPYMQLEKVIGLSSKSSNSIAVNPINGEVAYPAGCIICIYSPKENKQVKFLFSRNQRSFSCLTFSHNGRYFAAGEGAFRQPEITVWEINLEGNYEEIKHLKGHKYGIESVLFSPNLEYLISLGDMNDRGLFVWDWDKEQRVTSNKLGKPVNTFAFAESGEFFVTAGYQHLKYWYFDENGRVMKTETNSKESIMESKSADLTKVRLKVFVGVACKGSQVFAMAADGHLYVYDKNRKLTKWMNIKVDKALSCTMSQEYLICGCSDGVVRLFGTKSLEHILTLPKPPPLGSANIESGVKKIRIPATKDSKFADVISVNVDEQNQRVVVLYSDRMIFIWDIKILDKISVYRTALSHAGPIHDIQYIPNSVDLGYIDETAGVQLQDESALTRFATCSSDRTIRFWHFIDPVASSQVQQQISKGLVKNAYCKDMSRMIYVNSDSRDQQAQGQFDHFKLKPMKLNEDGTTPEQATLSGDPEMEQQVRCLRISPDAKHVACGDWTGNIRIHDLKGNCEEIQCIQAHENEVICLDYSPLIELSGAGNSAQNTSENQSSLQSNGPQVKYWLASGSRDRLTQIFEATGDKYENVTILEDHSSTITAVKFSEERSVKGQKRLKLISCGADKQLVFRNIDLSIVQNNDVRKLQNMNTEDFIVVQKKEQVKVKTFSMDLSPLTGYMVTGHDKVIQMWQISTGEKIWEKKPESIKKSSPMDQIRVALDQHAGVVISSCTDKFVTIYEAISGNPICRTTCGEITTALCLSTNFKHLITTSADGIIFVWKLPEQLSKALQKLKSEAKQKEEELPSTEEIEQRQESGNNNDEFNEMEDLQPQTLKQAEEKANKNEPLRISEVMKQITKATGQIDRIQPKNPGKAEVLPDSESEEDFDFGTPGIQQPPQKQKSPEKPNKDDQVKKDPASLLEEALNDTPDDSPLNAQNQDKKKKWGNQWQKPKDPFKQFDSNPTDSNLSSNNEEDPHIRSLQVKENKLPRWAQSVTGDQLAEDSRITGISRQVTKNEEEKKASIDQIKNQIMQQLEQDKSGEEFEEIFSNTLEKAQKQQQHQAEPSSIGQNVIKHQPTIGQTAVSKSAFYDKIEEEQDEDEKSNEETNKSQEQEDDEEKMINEQLRRRQMQKSRILIGLDDENSDTENHHKSRMRLRQNESRTSLSQQFFQRKLGVSSEQNLFRDTQKNELSQIQNQYLNQAKKKDEELKVEDLFNEDGESSSFQNQKSLANSQSQFIQQVGRPQSQLIQNQTPFTEKKPQFTIINKNNQSISSGKSNQIDIETIDIKKKVQEKYEQQKKQIEEQYKLQQVQLEEKVKQERAQMEKQVNMQRSQINTQEKEKINEIETNRRPQNEILAELDNEIRQDTDFLKVKEGNEVRSRSKSGQRQMSPTSHSRYGQKLEEDEVQINTVSQSNAKTVDEAALNAVLKGEMDKINNSLAKITQCLNSGSSFQKQVNVRDEVADTLGRSMGLWNSMMMSLSNRTSLNVSQITQSQQIGSSVSASQFGGGLPPQMSQSFFSQVSIKDDARDLLQKYSEMLIEEVTKKISKRT